MTQKALRASLTILIAGVPLALVTGVFVSHDVIPKTFLLLIGAAVLLFLLPHWSGGIPGLWARPAGRWFLILAMAQAGSLMVSTLLSTQPALSFAGTIWRRFGSVEQVAVLVIAVALACMAATQPEWPRTLQRAMVVGGGIAAVYGILQYFNLDPILPRSLYTIEYYAGIVRPPATLGHAIYFAAYLAPVTLIAAGLVLTESGVESRAWRWVAGAIALLCTIAVVLSGTRGSLIAIAAGGALFAWESGSARKIAFAAGAVILIIGGIALTPPGANLRHRFAQWREDLGGPRLGMWRESPEILEEYPLSGAGPETFAVEFRRIQSAALSRAYPEFYQETPHNAYIDAATAQGFPGLLILIGILWLGRRSPPVIAIAAGALFASFTQVTFLYLWVLTALIASRSPLPATNKAAHKRKNSASPKTPFEALAWRIPAALLGCAFTAIAILLCLQDAAYARLRDAAAAHNLPAAENAWNAAVRDSFGMPGYELWASRQMATLGVALTNKPGAPEAWKTAAEASSLAETEGEERFSAIYQSAVLAVAAGDLPRAETKAREAIEIAPNWYKPHLLLAQILQASGKNDQSLQEARSSADLGWQPPQQNVHN